MFNSFIFYFIYFILFFFTFRLILGVHGEVAAKNALLG